MYCICCKKNNVFPDLKYSDGKTEEEELWGIDSISNGDGKYRARNINNKMIVNGIINVIDAGYGSKHDTDQFIIAICDDCIELNLHDGTLLYYGNYFYPECKSTNDLIDKSKSYWRRRSNIDKLT